MARQNTKDSSEKFQIAILTFAMTACGFALLTAVFGLFLNPGAKSEADALERNYDELKKILSSTEMKTLRNEWKRQENVDTTKSIGDIVLEALNSYGIGFPNFPKAGSKNIKAGLDKVEQSITINPAKLSSILMFIAKVQDAKRTIQVEEVKLRRDPRSKTDEQLWGGTISFADYVTKS